MIGIDVSGSDEGVKRLTPKKLCIQYEHVIMQ